jgi:large subunit ribosomal protein L22
MSKEKNPRRVAENEAMAKVRMLRTSPQKLNLVAQLIRGKKVEKALADLTFSKRRIAGDVKKCLQSAIANAENNHNLDVDELVVAEAWVGARPACARRRPFFNRRGDEKARRPSPPDGRLLAVGLGAWPPVAGV